MNVKDYKKRFDSMKNEAQSWNGAWKDIQRFLAPGRGFFDAQPNQGKSFDHKVLIDSTQIRALRTMASGMTSGLTSPSRPWFKLVLPDEGLMKFKPALVWLNDVQEIMMTIFSKSNIYSALYNVYEEIGAFGTAALGIFADMKQVVFARNFTCGEYYLSIDANGMANGFGREYYQTVDQLVEQFKLENCSRRTRDLYKDKQFDSWIKVTHLIEANRSYNPDIIDNSNMAYSSCYWEEGAEENEILLKSGFRDFPILAPRWATSTNFCIYGRGPGWDSLGDIKMLQKLQKDKLLGVEKTVNPPTQVDASVIGEPNLLPGGVTRTSGLVPNVGIRTAYEVNLNLAALQATINETQLAIEKMFYTDLFAMMQQIDRGNMTAREVAVRHEEKLLLLGSVLERLETELLDPLINRTYHIMLENGMLPIPPAEIMGMSWDVQYISILAQAQRMVGIAAIQDVASFTGGLTAVYPESKDVFNADIAVREFAKNVGVNPTLIRSEEEVQQIRAQRAKQMKEQQQMEMLKNGTGAFNTAAQGAKTLSEIKDNELLSSDSINRR